MFNHPNQGDMIEKQNGITDQKDGFTNIQNVSYAGSGFNFLPASGNILLKIHLRTVTF